MLDDIGDLNRLALDEYHDPETKNRMAQFEMAFRTQDSAPLLADMTKDTACLYVHYCPEYQKHAKHVSA